MASVAITGLKTQKTCQEACAMFLDTREATSCAACVQVEEECLG
eukprot:CAMPEP_0177411500 /NCGR_PEP_ID=MMETSP0368-20130122/65454_1 /TAXON_ID=447022 ORGANISM="Scrippsiella hangoei-like, Strain SHHI-4" /NCGR_SAMPLE_ID=MMETSP0368 /ASSEMBLY_ACC=CAM_ASM_000363 /LENGTH=43 /DNA_ID= /DNA_START= /DNA_END= /DNA_ORIENTATION=